MNKLFKKSQLFYLDEYKIFNNFEKIYISKVNKNIKRIARQIDITTR